jgi:beta-carotene hydroxylase
LLALRRIRKQLRGSLNLADPVPGRPAGMHWSTHAKLVNRHEAAQAQAREKLPLLVNGLVGRLGGLPLTISLPLFRGVHYEHHSHTNDAARDPDLIVAHRPRMLLPLWLVGITVSYRTAFYGRRLWRTTGQFLEALAVDVALNALVIAAIVGGWLVPLAVVWLAPAVLAVLFLAFAFDFLPHYPYDTRARYFDTRITPGAALNVVLLGQNHHLIHHLWTTIPWYRYRGVFAAIAGDLARRGCRIGWRATPLPEDVPTLATS